MFSLFNRKAVLILSLVLIPLLTGCGGGGGSNNTDTGATISETTPNGLKANLSEDKTNVTVGDIVNYMLTVTNTSSQPVATYGYTDSTTDKTTPAGGIEVVNAMGSSVYPPIIGAPPPPFPPPIVTLQPGQSLSKTFSVQAFSNPGKYQATALFVLIGSQVSLGPMVVTAR